MQSALVALICKICQRPRNKRKVAHGGVAKRKRKPTMGTETVIAVIATAHAGGVTSDLVESSVMR